MLSQLTHQIMTHELAQGRTSHELAFAAMMAYGKLFVHVSALVGEGSPALFRRSVKLTPFPFFTAICARDSEALLMEVQTALAQQQPEVVVEASITLMTAFVELVAGFIGTRLIGELLQAAWPSVVSARSDEERPT